MKQESNLSERGLLLAQLGELQEHVFRGDVLMPLYRAMGFLNVSEIHGQNEFGKDIVFRYADQFGEPIYCAALVKSEKIHGSSAREGNISEVLAQAREAVAMPLSDRFDGFAEKSIVVLYVVTSQSITPKACTYLQEQLRRAGHFGTMRFHDGERILDLLARHCPEIVEGLLLRSFRASWASASFSGSRFAYPTLRVYFSTNSQALAEVLADFDTGMPSSLMSLEEAIRIGLCPPPKFFVGATSIYRGMPYRSVNVKARLSLDRVRFAEITLQLVESWDSSPFSSGRRDRVMLMGQDIPVELRAKIVLDFSSMNESSGEIDASNI